MNTNQFLYFRDIKNDVKPQHEDTFSAPADALFFQKFVKHLLTPHTDACMAECFTQFDAHCRLPLQAQRFLADPETISVFKTYFEKNVRFQPVLATCLVHLFENKSACLFQKLESQVTDDILGLIFDNLIQHPKLILILEQIWENKKLIDLNESNYLIKFEEYLYKAQSKEEVRQQQLRDHVGGVCSCLSILTQLSLQQQAKCLQLMQKYVFKILLLHVPNEELIQVLQFIQIQVLSDPKICCYLVQDNFCETLMKFTDSFNTEIQILSINLISLTIQHYPESLSFYKAQMDKLASTILYIVSGEDDLALSRIAMDVQRLKDGPLRATLQFDEIIKVLIQKQAWGEGVDGEY
ncbi:Conserved_hypothetical protein [Hexamita inflata]|uniref:Uncharacterized protein n=1 Tax=Hexamita inflata TaxID=28002 RepID=A0AA86NSR0_9EUKA|nr:Conserved hypothetical protein [Hexamita inflata]